MEFCTASGIHMPPPTPSALCVCPIGTKKQKENLITFKFMTVTAFSQGNLPRQPPYCGGHGVGFLQRSFSWVSCCSLYFILSVGVANFEGLSVLHCALPFSFWDCPPPRPRPPLWSWGLLRSQRIYSLVSVQILLLPGRETNRRYFNKKARRWRKRDGMS